MSTGVCIKLFYWDTTYNEHMLKAAKSQNKYSFWIHYLSKNGHIEVAIFMRYVYLLEYQILLVGHY